MPTQSRDHVVVLTDGRQDPGLATLINSLVRNGFDGTLWVGRRGHVDWLSSALPQSVSDQMTIEHVEVDTNGALHYHKPQVIEKVWQMAGPDAASVIYMDCDLVLGCDWAFVRAWVATGLAIVEDLPGRVVGTQHPLRRAWHAFMASAGITAVREVGQYFNSGFVGVPAECRSILPLWKEIGSALERMTGAADPTRTPFGVVELRAGAWDGGVSPDVQALMRPYFLEDQDALNMAVMASTVPISPMGPDAMGFTATRTPILPHAVGPEKPWSKAYLRNVLVSGEGPSFADDVWWSYSDHPIKVARGWRYVLRRCSWRASKVVARIL